MGINTEIISIISIKNNNVHAKITNENEIKIFVFRTCRQFKSKKYLFFMSIQD